MDYLGIQTFTHMIKSMFFFIQNVKIKYPDTQVKTPDNYQNHGLGNT